MAVAVLINAHLIKTWIAYIPTLAPPTFLLIRYLLNIDLYVSAYKTITQYMLYSQRNQTQNHEILFTKNLTLARRYSHETFSGDRYKHFISGEGWKINYLL